MSASNPFQYSIWVKRMNGNHFFCNPSSENTSSMRPTQESTIPAWFFFSKDILIIKYNQLMYRRCFYKQALHSHTGIDSLDQRSPFDMIYVALIKREMVRITAKPATQISNYYTGGQSRHTNQIIYLLILHQVLLSICKDYRNH